MKYNCNLLRKRSRTTSLQIKTTKMQSQLPTNCTGTDSGAANKAMQSGPSHRPPVAAGTGADRILHRAGTHSERQSCHSLNSCSKVTKKVCNFVEGTLTETEAQTMQSGTARLCPSRTEPELKPLFTQSKTPNSKAPLHGSQIFHYASLLSNPLLLSYHISIE